VKGIRPVSYANGDAVVTDDQKSPELADQLPDECLPETQAAEGKFV